MGNEVLKGERKIIKYKVMKKILYCLLLLLSVFTINAKPRKIVIDKQVENARIIEAQGTSIGGFTATKILFIGYELLNKILLKISKTLRKSKTF